MNTPPPALLDAFEKKDLAAVERALAAGESPVGWQSLRLALHYQCNSAPVAPAEGALEMVELLLRHGANPNEVGDAGNAAPSALSVAASLWHPALRSAAPAIIRRLLEAGGDPMLPDSLGHSSVWTAARSATTESFACLLSAVSHLPRESLQTLFEAAVGGDEPEAKVDLLLAAGIKPTTRAIVDAFQARGEVVAQTFLALGVDVNTCDEAGFTPLHNAVSRGHAALVDALVAGGASLTAKLKKSDPVREMKKGDTPVMVAERRARELQVSLCEVLLRALTETGATTPVSQSTIAAVMHMSRPSERAAAESMLRNAVIVERHWTIGATPLRYPATVEGAFAAAIQIVEPHDRAAAESMRNPVLRADVVVMPKVVQSFASMERAEKIALRVGASLEPVPPTIHGKWKRLYVDDIEHGHVKGTATLELKKDGTFEAQLSREKLSGTFTHDASASAPLTLTSKKGPLEVEFDGTELRITRPTKKSEPNALAVTYFVFGPPK